MIDKSVLDSLSPKEREVALKIMEELKNGGSSKTFNSLKYADYTEIPVDIETFLHNKKYLGNGLYDPNGRFTLFPFWEEKLKQIFPTNVDTAYNTLVLTGAIGIGKSTLAVICLLYMLYRLLCLKDPYLYYGMQPIDKISISLMNITIENAKGVALDKMNQLILSSEWFMSHGEMTGTTNLLYKPEKHIELITGSSNNQVIGRAIFCLDGDTEIVTTEGIKKLKSLVEKKICVVGVDDCGNQIVSDECTVIPTIVSDEEYSIELDDGTTIKCTPNHLLMLSDGSYKMAKDLNELDELAESQYNGVGAYKEFIENIINTRGQWNIPSGEYFEAHHIVPRCVGGSGRSKVGRMASKHKNIIWLYAHEHFIAHKLLAQENPNNKALVLAWSMMAFPKGKTQRDYEITPQEYEELREALAKTLSGKKSSFFGKEPWNKGKKGIYSEETLNKIRAPRLSMRGVKWSEDRKNKLSNTRKKLLKEHPELKVSPTFGRVSITNGDVVKYIKKRRKNTKWVLAGW